MAAFEAEWSAWNAEHGFEELAYREIAKYFWETRLATAYELLADLGNYKDAATYLANFSVVEDVLLMYKCRSSYDDSSYDDDAYTYYGSDFNVYKSIRHYSPDGQLAEIDKHTSIMYIIPWDFESLDGTRAEFSYSGAGPGTPLKSAWQPRRPRSPSGVFRAGRWR